jgi:hypothetical protein
LGGSLPVANRLADPVLELYDETGSLVRINNNWRDSQRAEIAATGHAPSQDTESALLVALGPGRYTAVLLGVDNTVGVGKIDVIDVDATAASRLDNVSSRARVSAGENVLLGGFVINGPQSRKVLIRGIGPSLFYIADAIYDPSLQLRDGSGAPLVFNDNWRDTQETEVIDSALPPGEERESAIVATLRPGSYTAELLGLCGAGGVALVEVYDLGPAGDAHLIPPSSALPRCFSAWLSEHGLAGAQAAPTGDPDGDGILNALEYATGKNPNVSDAPATQHGTVVLNGRRFLSLSYTRPTGTNAPDDVIYSAQRATSLAPANWSSAPTQVTTHSVTPGPGALETVTVRSTTDFGTVRREFLRLQVTLTAP